MRKIQKAAVVVAMLGSVSLVGAGTAAASGGNSGHSSPKIDIKQSATCKSHDINIALLNNIGVANGALGNLLGGEGNPGAQVFEQGSEQGCNVSAG